MTNKETTTERRARVALAEQQAQARWEAVKHQRLITALARAHDLGVSASVYHRHGNVVYYSFSICVDYSGTWTGTVAELSEHVMSGIESDLDGIAAEQARRRHLAQVKEDLIARLSNDEREALGL